jgi:hypothetical protein
MHYDENIKNRIEKHLAWILKRKKKHKKSWMVENNKILQL